MKVIAGIEDPVVIKQILEHLERHADQSLAITPTVRAPPRNRRACRTDGLAASYSTHGSYASRDICTNVFVLTVRRTPSRQQKSPGGLLISVSLPHYSRNSGRRSPRCV